MAHLYSGKREDKAGASRARHLVKSAGYAEGGEVRQFPISQFNNDWQRMRSTLGVARGDIQQRSGNVVQGPGHGFTGSGSRTWADRISRQRTEDMPHKRGGKVKK